METCSGFFASPNDSSSERSAKTSDDARFPLAKTFSHAQRSSLSKMANFLPKIQFLQQELKDGRRNV